MTILISIIIASFSLALAIYTFIQNQTLKRRFVAALGTVDGQSLEITLADHLSRVAQVDHRLSQLDTSYEHLIATTSLASQKISIVRFNPFGDTGGDQSFSLAVLDAHDSGYVLSSIHGRTGSRMYVKPIDFGKSKYTLSTEEQQSLEQAVKRVPQEDRI